MEISENITGNNPFESLASIDFSELTKHVDTSVEHSFRLKMPENDFDRKELYRFVRSVVQISGLCHKLAYKGDRNDIVGVLDKIDENNFDNVINNSSEMHNVSKLLLFFAGKQEPKGFDQFPFPFTGADLKIWKSETGKNGEVTFSFNHPDEVATKFTKMANDAGLKIDTTK